ncbi:MULTISPECIES: ExbD/TolR family protein [Chlamydia]|uniref:Biopolymer transporter ExbD n=1 Tax=Chlamydophila parapsittaci TaxID=344886 RepID=A0ABX5VZ11_9CHLA|nr:MULTISPECIES: biopolymer transporter ExbD [Chlamydia]AFS20062.1 biopolymer transport ExbD/TolR family protein [Chlamydia psittaci 84/55]AFS23247.1 biopolymer transport ExbD/TolR family protein [Chlamydia psittaci VS225]AGE75552.1 biopolymer transport protein ExbD [Chlamydia psittaci Mat116]EPJ15781.1 biopolymer transport ExbD/TolR family protein [Chlamydia psittaci 02DC18]EPJ17417.1 biopolymer transport ExbD/TolR family protein [Chlamydia psittaci 02DC22]EPJ19641.1 biopolymer transport Exb
MKRIIVEDTEEDPNVNLTPLIDIVFVILMAFMIAMPLIRIDSIALAPGTQNHKVLAKEDALSTTIKVLADHTITLNDQALSLGELKTQLALLHQQHPNQVPLLLQDGDTPFRLYQEVKTTIESAGFHELHIALKS